MSASRNRRRALCGLAVAVALLAAGCRREARAVARLESHPAHLVLGYPEFAEVELAIQPLAALPEGTGAPIVFLHLVEAPDTVVRTFDHPLPQRWRVGEEIRYRVRVHQSALAEPLEPGEYTLVVGLYDRELGRYALATADAEVGRFEYKVGVVEVPAADQATPHVRFSENWLPTEPGADRQVLARRTLSASGDGTLQIGPLQGPGRLVLGLEIPGGATGSARLELAPGETQVRVRVSASCTDQQAEFSGAGRHDLDLTLHAEPTPVTCEVVISPNFQLISSERAEATSVRLELVSWAKTVDDTP